MKMSAGNYYDKIAHLYDIMYTKKTGFDHEAQVKWADNWRKKLDLSKKVLDLACGTGSHLIYFKKLRYDCQGIDASKKMLQIAKRKLKNVPLKIGFFHNFKLKEKVPIITSFFNSMSYNTDKEELNEALKNIYRNLSHGGIFVFDTICNANPKKVFAVKVFEEKNLKFSRTFVGIPTPKGFKSTMYYVVFDGKSSEIIEETTYRGSFSEKEVKDILKQTGFNVLYSGDGYTDGTTVFVAQK